MTDTQALESALATHDAAHLRRLGYGYAAEVADILEARGYDAARAAISDRRIGDLVQVRSRRDIETARRNWTRLPADLLCDIAEAAKGAPLMAEITTHRYGLREYLDAWPAALPDSCRPLVERLHEINTADLSARVGA